MDKPLVAVSACLLGQKVRYDGKDKYTSLIAEELAKSCHLIAICPEVEIGLGVPRDKIQLTQVGTEIKVLKINDPTVDVSKPLAELALQFIRQHALSGLVLQDKSPSCGLGNVKLFSETGEQIGISSGFFVAAIVHQKPNLPVALASQLLSKQDVSRFLQSLLKNY
jgi:uncharacterized protein YbbK (DUF523 family)